MPLWSFHFSANSHTEKHSKMCPRRKNKREKVLEGAAVLAGWAKKGLPEEGMSEQRLEESERL